MTLKDNRVYNLTVNLSTFFSAVMKVGRMMKVLKDEIGEFNFVVSLLGYVTFCFDPRCKQIL